MSRKKKRRIRYDRIIIFLLIIILLIILIKTFLNLKISNIVILNNEYLKDQDIIEMAEISDYPYIYKVMNNSIKNKLEKNILIKEAKVYKKNLTRIYIEVVENRPLFYYYAISKTVLLDGRSIDNKYVVPTVLNYITDNCYNDFITAIGNVNPDILSRISEIEYVPNEVDDNRFLLKMTDGNNVYININTFNKLNKYIEILEGLPKKNGTLYLDYGNNFEVFND